MLPCGPVSKGRGSCSASVCHSTCCYSWFPQWTVAPQCRQHSCSPRPWHSHLGMGTENRYFFGPVRNWVNTGLPVSVQTDTVIDTCVVYLRILQCNDVLEAAAWHFPSLNDVAFICLACVWYSCTYACVFACCSGGETFKSVGSRYKTKRLQHQMQYAVVKKWTNEATPVI